ncbi:MAG: PPK2 family polyphosphate kinase, partial [Planctomycetaceae bacterium]
MALNAEVHRVKLGDSIKLSDLPTSGKQYSDDKEGVIADFEKQREMLIDLQYRFYAEGQRKLLVIIQAMDCGGKDGTIRHVFQGVNSQGVRVTSFKVPTSEERSYDFLWRIHREVPKTGMIGVFNRSHYEDIVAVRVMRLAEESIWKPRYEYINDFERMLTGSGTTIVKFFLHISKDEQRERLQSRIDDPAKRWKFAADDLEKRLDWEEYMNAYS